MSGSFISLCTLLLPLLTTSTPLPSAPAITHDAAPAAPWAGKGPKPPARPSFLKIAPAPYAAADSAVPVGQVITSCTQPGTVALTFDDGPYIYTGQVLDTLKNADVKATFFVNGDNWATILSDSSQALVQRMLSEGHQIGSHTYAFQPSNQRFQPPKRPRASTGDVNLLTNLPAGPTRTSQPSTVTA